MTESDPPSDYTDKHEQVVNGLVKLGAGLAADEVPGLSTLGKLMKVFVKSGDDRFQEAIAAEISDAVFSRWPEIERRLSALEVSNTTSHRYFELLVEAFQKATDPKSKEQAVNAFVGAFDEALYNDALTQRLLEVLTRLDYADVSVLRSAAKGDNSRKNIREHTLEEFHAARLMGEGLVDMPQATLVLTTEVGNRLIGLIDSGAAKPSEEPASS